MVPSVQKAGQRPGRVSILALTFESPVLPRMLPAGHDAGRGVLDVLAPTLPVAASGRMGRVGLPLAPSLDDQKAATAGGVLRLVPLKFVVADETALERPIFLVEAPVLVELVGPDQPIALCLGRLARRHHRGQKGDRHRRQKWPHH